MRQRRFRERHKVKPNGGGSRQTSASPVPEACPGESKTSEVDRSKQDAVFPVDNSRASFAIGFATDDNGIISPLPVIGRKKRLPPAVAAILIAVFGLLLSTFHAPAVYAQSLSSQPSRANEGAPAKENLLPKPAALQKVVHRKPVPFRPYAHVPEYLLVYCVEKLECGHELHTHPQADPLIAMRRRCQKCGSVGVPKKLPTSVKLSRLDVRKVA